MIKQHESLNKLTEIIPYFCIYQDPKFTIETVLILAVMVSLMVALFTKPIDMIFDLLTAPVADEMKIVKNDGMLSSLVRRMSNFLAAKQSYVYIFQ